MIVINAPERTPETNKKKVFLAGSIENGVAENWQKKMLDFLEPYDIMVFNPRRDNWDSSWTDDNPELQKQIKWELQKIKESDLVYFYFDPDTKSPISLLELGLCVGWNKNIIVCCPDNFYRRKNVEITALLSSHSLICNTFDISKTLFYMASRLNFDISQYGKENDAKFRR